MSSRPTALYLLGAGAFTSIYGEEEQAQISALAEVLGPPVEGRAWRNHRDMLGRADIIFSGWGSPALDEEFLAAAPRLRAYLYGAGSIKRVATDAFWPRDIPICSAYAANAVPVVEFTLAQIILLLKHAWRYAHEVRALKSYPRREPMPGAFGTTVGLVSLGMIGRMVAQRLQSLDVKVIAHDPFAREEDAAALGVRLCPLGEVFSTADVVSLHTPWLPETERLIRGRHFALMKKGASFLNTARGAVVDEPEMIAVLSERLDLFAALDVTHPEPPVPDSPLYTLPNVILTPHIAGSLSGECRRMGQYMIEELRRLVAGEPLRWRISREQAATLA